MTKSLTDFAFLQRTPKNTTNHSLQNKAAANIVSQVTSLARLRIVIAACLLAQAMTFATLANAEDFGLIGSDQPPEEVEFATPANVDQTSIDGQTDYASTDDQSAFIPIDQSEFTEQSWGQTYDQSFDAGIEQVTYDQTDYNAQYSDPASVQEIVGDVISSQIYSDGYEIPASETYSSYNGATTVPSQSYSQTYTSSSSSSGNVQPGLAQQKAVQAAQGGIQGHLGGGLGGAKYEGVGWSNRSAQNAIQSCCYWGTRPTAQIGVSKGNDGFWYACVLYY